VHLTDWPCLDDPTGLPADEELVAAMDEVREVASVALSLRKGAKLRVRQPLAALTVASAAADRLQQFSGLLADEVNVRRVTITGLGDAGQDSRIERRLVVNARAAGPRLGKQVQQVIGAAKKGDWSSADGVVRVGGVVLQEGEYSLELVAAGGGTDVIGMLRSGGFVSLDTVLDDELLAQGWVNDLLRLIQQARKNAEFDVSDRITLALQVPTSSGVPSTAAASRWPGKRLPSAWAGYHDWMPQVLTCWPARSATAWRWSFRWLERSVRDVRVCSPKGRVAFAQ